MCLDISVFCVFRNRRRRQYGVWQVDPTEWLHAQAHNTLSIQRTIHTDEQNVNVLCFRIQLKMKCYGSGTKETVRQSQQYQEHQECLHAL